MTTPMEVLDPKPKLELHRRKHPQQVFANNEIPLANKPTLWPIVTGKRGCYLRLLLLVRRDYNHRFFARILGSGSYRASVLHVSCSVDQDWAMEFDISGNPAYGDLTVALEAGESFWSEGGAMSRMSSHMQLGTRMVGGLLKSVVRRVAGGESLFISEYTAPEMAFVSLTPTCPGTVLHRKIDGDVFFLTSGSFLACTPGINLETRFGGLRSLFSNEGAFLIEVTGHGDLFFNSFGGVIEKEIEGGLVVDTGHVVGWEPTLDYTIGGMGGMKQTLFSGEGLVMRFKGNGKIYLQTRHLGSMAGWLTPYCP